MLLRFHFGGLPKTILSDWYPNLNKRLKSILLILQNKCILFCLNLDNRVHIGQKEFEKLIRSPLRTTSNKLLAKCLLNFAI